MSAVLAEQNVPARMRDGVTLRANIFRPAAPGRHPVLLARLPYGKEAMFPRLAQILDPVRAAWAGYVVILQDCRGRFSSEGEFGALEQEGPDGYDAVEWAAGLPFSNGAVAMFGPSYLGWTQWAAAMQRPPHLMAIAPMITFANAAGGLVRRGGALELGLNRMWRLAMHAETAVRRLRVAGAPPAQIQARVRALAGAIDRLSCGEYFELPLVQLASLTELELADCLAGLLTADHGRSDAAAKVAFDQVEVPALSIGGWYDVFAQGTIDAYTELRTRGRGRARQSQLLMAPWAHGVMGASGGTAIGEAEFGLAANAASVDLADDLTAIHLRWFDHWLKGADNGVDREPPVRAFVMGENLWRALPDWPPPGVTEQRWYLQPGGGLGPATAPGAGAAAPWIQGDPADPADASR